MPDRRYSAEEVDAAVAALADPELFAHAQEIVTHAAPGLQSVLAHAAFALEHGGTTVLIDPFLTGNPTAAASADEVAADAILLTHGHADHLGDAVAIAKRTGAPVVAIVELAGEVAEEGVETFDPNIGG